MVTRLKPLKETRLANSVEKLIIKNRAPILIYDQETAQIRYANNAAVGAYGYSPEDFATLSMENVFHNKFDFFGLRNAFLSKDGITMTGIVAHEDSVGDTFNVQMYILPIMYEDEKAILTKIRVVCSNKG